jgi:hypothetical protein
VRRPLHRITDIMYSWRSASKGLEGPSGSRQDGRLRYYDTTQRKNQFSEKCGRCQLKEMNELGDHGFPSEVHFPSYFSLCQQLPRVHCTLYTVQAINSGISGRFLQLETPISSLHSGVRSLGRFLLNKALTIKCPDFLFTPFRSARARLEYIN